MIKRVSESESYAFSGKEMQIHLKFVNQVTEMLPYLQFIVYSLPDPGIENKRIS